MADACERCGGGIDDDHPTTCGACRFELSTRLNYERAVDASMKLGIPLREFVRRSAARSTPTEATDE